MKNKVIKSLFVISAATTLLGSVGCNKLEDFGDTNVRSDASTQPTTVNLITSAETSVPNLFSSTISGIRGSLYSQQWAETQYTDVSLYGNPQLDFSGTYAGPLMDLQKVIDLNTDPATKSGFNVVGTVTNPLGSNGNQIGIAKILKVYYLWTLTDRWGDIPYSEALKGAADLTPKYDLQSDIYVQMLTDLKDAIAAFDGGNTVKGDVFYSGDAAKWKKLANSLRMLIALRMSKVYPNAGGLAATEFSAASDDANGAILTNADNLKIVYNGSTALETNVFYSALNGRKDYAFSKTLGDILTNMSDARRTAYGTTGAAFPYGLERNDAVAFDGSVSGVYAQPINTTFRTTSSPISVVPAAYVLLAKAEAAQRGWISGSAETFYTAGVTASFDQWGMASSAAAYLAGTAANFTNGTGGGNNIGDDATYHAVVGASANTSTALQRIQLQRYLASFGDGLQAWCEWRRTGVPDLKPTAYGVNTPREIPRRLTYGTGEYAANPDNVAEAASRLSGGDKMNSRMWWDQ
ncbi:MAG: SusD/RagB family nutrient-binding outer membrane lipoprotein [Ferruginibacter sp.]